MRLPEGSSLLLVELGVLICFAHIVAFVLFAVIRILTGVSIHRLGFFSLRHISFTLPSGILVEIGKVELDFHRPSFSRPTWITLAVADVSLYNDPFDESSFNVSTDRSNASPAPGMPSSKTQPETPMSPDCPKTKATNPKHSTWKEAIRRFSDACQKFHRVLKYLKLLDFSIKNVTLIAEDIGKLHIRSQTFSLDQINPKSKFFTTVLGACGMSKDLDTTSIVTWRFTIKDIFYEPENSPAEELLDMFQLEVYDVFDKTSKLTKNLSLNIRVGNLTLPFDSYSRFYERLRLRRKRRLREMPPSQTDLLLKTLADDGPPDDLINSLYLLLDAVREVRVHVAKVGIYKFSPECDYSVAREHPIYFSLSTKDFTIDLRRLSQNSPGHRMFFPREDVSHQAIMTAISISVGLADTKTGVHDDLVYIPMITMSSTTNVLRKSLDIYTGAETDRNSSLLKGSLSINSPAVDVRARHLPLFVSIFTSIARFSNSEEDSLPPRQDGSKRQAGIRLVELLPRTIIKLSIEEPGARVKVDDDDTTEKKSEGGMQDIEESRILASSCSIINCELESSHTPLPYPHYGLTASFRMTEFSTWVRGPNGRHEFAKAESFSLRMVAQTSPVLDVTIIGSLTSIGVFLTRPENVNSLKDLVSRIKFEVWSIGPGYVYKPEIKGPTSQPSKKNFMRLIPPWLSHVRLEGSDVMMCASSKDQHHANEIVKDVARGLAVQAESWIIDYKPHVTPHHNSVHGKRHHRSSARTESTAGLSGSDFPHTIEALTTKTLNTKVDRRRLAIGFKGIEIFTIDANDILEQTMPLLIVPDIEIAMLTYWKDTQFIAEINVLLKKMIANYSLFHHYSLLLAIQALTLITSHLDTNKKPTEVSTASRSTDETVYFDIRSQHIRVKAHLPLSPPIMFEAVGLEFSKKGSKAPAATASFFRIFVESANGGGAWERFLVLRRVRAEMINKLPHVDLGVPSISASVISSAETTDDDITLGTDAISLSIPHGLLVYELLEGIVTSFKAVKQMTHEFKYHSSKDILKPTAKKPVKMPRVRIRSKIIEMRVEDDPFESRLGLIFTVGMIEMKSRLAREAAFEAKVQTLKAAKDKIRDLGAGVSVANANSRGPNEPDIEHEGLKRKHTFKTMKGMKHHRHSRLKRAVPIRYSPMEAEMPSDTAKISTEEAYNKLRELHSNSWIRRITRARQIRAASIEARRRKGLGPDEVDTDLTNDEKIISVPDAPPLFQILFSDPNIILDKPRFPLQDVHKFLHKIGKGVPETTEYSLLVPLFWNIDMSEFRILLRDYPLPFFHVPPMSSLQSAKSPAWSLKSDIVIAEEIFDEGSYRYIQCPIVPRIGKSEDEYHLTVTRTISAVKMYSTIDINIATSEPTRITWAPSLQPAIQQTMMRFDTITKPPIDPSPKVGFWDKIRLIFHSKIRLSWIDGAVHLLLKGSHDPYSITGAGAGFAMCWENNVTLDINPNEKQQDFMVVDSENFLLAVPDFSYYVRQLNAPHERAGDSLSTFSDSQSSNARFHKIIMKLSGNLRWKAGLLFERETEGGQRTFESVPHYTVQLKRPDAVSSPGSHDSYAGFRSDYIHLALTVVSPRDEEWTAFSTKQPSTSTNSIHLTPQTFTHFFKWWDLFAGEMSLPIRNGNLFPPIMVSKKFGRHLATIKYQFVLRSLSISHMYLYKRDDDINKKVLNSVGLKGRINSFMMDLHQRREFITYTDKVRNEVRRRRKMRLNVGELDFQSADIRGVTVSFKERTAEELASQIGDPFGDSEINSPPEPTGGVPPLAKLKVSDNDLTWIDIDDYTELDSFVGSENLSSVKVLPLIFTPRFTYYRQTEHNHSAENDTSLDPEVAPFGDEPSHTCLLGQTGKWIDCCS